MKHDLNLISLSESCKLEIWSGENFTGDHAECTDACDMHDLGAVGNDRARSAKCTCDAPKPSGVFKRNLC